METRFIIEEITTKQYVEADSFSYYNLGVQDSDVGVNPHLFETEDLAKKAIQTVMEDIAEFGIFEIKNVYICDE